MQERPIHRHPEPPAIHEHPGFDATRRTTDAVPRAPASAARPRRGAVVKAAADVGATGAVAWTIRRRGYAGAQVEQK
ncbi:hypothetical protein Asp14428_06710 [Actinoplanes sp. NBRC 14428]|nr:hypothetical protein Asp14428_06710 [Actinoplanes sp. NBRC 14428]